MSETTTPGPNPRANHVPNPVANPGPTPASVGGDVPVEAWRISLAEAEEAPAAERHAQLNSLLNDLDAQVGSL